MSSIHRLAESERGGCDPCHTLANAGDSNSVHAPERQVMRRGGDWLVVVGGGGWHAAVFVLVNLLFQAVQQFLA